MFCIVVTVALLLHGVDAPVVKHETEQMICK